MRLPPQAAGAVPAVLLGIAFGLCAYTFHYAKGTSYLTNNPAACANCHVMQSQHDSWIKSSHRSVAACNDCHTPRAAVPKYLTKASNGFWHSFAFTTGRFHEPIRIKERNLRIVNNACKSCHQDIVQAIDHPKAPSFSCIQCHPSVGHPDPGGAP